MVAQKVKPFTCHLCLWTWVLKIQNKEGFEGNEMAFCRHTVHRKLYSPAVLRYPLESCNLFSWMSLPFRVWWVYKLGILYPCRGFPAIGEGRWWALDLLLNFFGYKDFYYMTWLASADCLELRLKKESSKRKWEGGEHCNSRPLFTALDAYGWLLRDVAVTACCIAVIVASCESRNVEDQRLQSLLQLWLIWSN